MAKDSPHAVEFRKSLEGWTDERMVTKEQIGDLTMFILYLVNLSDEDGWTYDGHSLSLGSPMCRLVVRGTLDGVPSVVFCSGRTPMSCIHIFMRKMEEGWLEWSKDRFRT